MRFIIGYFSSNGYRCGCCRRTYERTEIEEFESKKEALNFCNKYNEKNKNDPDEHSIDYCYHIGDTIYES